MIEPFKYMIQPVALERDESGRVIREIPGEILSVYSAEKAAEAIESFEEQLARLVSENGNSEGRDDNGSDAVDR